MWENAKFVSLSSPLLSSTDKDGIVCGILDTVKTLVAENVLSFGTKGNTSRWGYFMLNPTALKKMTEYAELGQVDVYYDKSAVPFIPHYDRGDNGKRFGLNKISYQILYFQIKPVIQEEFGMSRIPEAFQKLQKGSSRGKIVIDMNA